MTLRLLPALSFALLCSCAGAVGAGNLSIQPLGTVALPAQATDQNGAAFSITGVSGLTFLPDGTLVAVMDNANRLIRFDPVFDADGTLMQAPVSSGITLSETRDFEDVVADCAGSAVLLCDEGSPGVRAYALADGTLVTTLEVPPVFAGRRANRGFEALAISPGGTRLWTANEEALVPDGPASSPDAPTPVRLLRYELVDGVWIAGPQVVYDVEPMHGPFVLGNGQSGLVALVSLPGERLLAVERSLGLASSLFRTRVYEVLADDATDVSDIAALVGETFVPVTKRLVYDGDHSNMEGLALGPEAANGGRIMVGVVDDGDPFSTGQLVSFRLDGFCACEADADPSAITVADLLEYLDRWFVLDASAERTGDCPASVNVSDLLAFLACWFAA